MTLSELIKKYRKEHGNMSQRQFALICSLSNGCISMLEKGTNSNTGEPITPTLPVLKKVAEGMNISLSELLTVADDIEIDLTDAYDLPCTKPFPAPAVAEDVVTFPVLGEVAAGYDHVALEEWEGETVEIPRSYLHGRPTSDYFVLRVKGESMYPFYMPGDKVLILRQDTLNYSGQVGAILYDGELATLKRVEYTEGEDWMRLVPLNPMHPPRIIEGADLELCRVLGVPRLLLRDIES